MKEIFQILKHTITTMNKAFKSRITEDALCL
jgi:hypothetical protein